MSCIDCYIGQSSQCWAENGSSSSIDFTATAVDFESRPVGAADGDAAVLMPA